jgi:hypothetical protein
MVAASGTAKAMATPVLASFPCFFLFSSLLLPSFSVLLFFFLFFSFHSDEQKLFCSLRFSFLSLAVFFCSFLSVFSSFSRSLEGLIYSLTYLYLGKI